MFIPMLTGGDLGIPVLGFFAYDFPQVAAKVKADESVHPILVNPAMPSTSFAVPVPVTFYENVCSQEYWDGYVRKFGMNAALKLPRMISAACYSPVVDQFSGAKVMGWKVLSENDTGLRQKIDNISMQTLLSMTAADREEHARIMRRSMVADFLPLIFQRDELVQNTMTAGEWCLKISQTDNNYKYGADSLLRMLSELLELHEKILAHLPLTEAAAGQGLQFMRTSLQCFHRNLRIYVASFLPNQYQAAQEGMMKLLTEFDRIGNVVQWLDVASLPPPATGAGTQDQTAEDLLAQAELSLERGHQRLSIELCGQVLGTIGISGHLAARVRILTATMTEGTRGDKIDLLRRALGELRAVDARTVPAHVDIQEIVAAAAAVRLAALEAEEEAASGMMF